MDATIIEAPSHHQEPYRGSGPGDASDQGIRDSQLSLCLEGQGRNRPFRQLAAERENTFTRKGDQRHIGLKGHTCRKAHDGGLQYGHGAQHERDGGQRPRHPRGPQSIAWGRDGGLGRRRVSKGCASGRRTCRWNDGLRCCSEWATC